MTGVIYQPFYTATYGVVPGRSGAGELAVARAGAGQFAVASAGASTEQSTG